MGCQSDSHIALLYLLLWNTYIIQKELVVIRKVFFIKEKSGLTSLLLLVIIHKPTVIRQSSVFLTNQIIEPLCTWFILENH